MSKMIIIAGTIDLADPGKRDEALAIAGPLQQKTRSEEPGCHAYVFAADPCVPGRIGVYELWQDEASLAAHFKHPNYLNMRTALGQIGLKGADNKKYRVDLSEPVYDPTMTPRADFFTEKKKPAKKKAAAKAKTSAKKAKSAKKKTGKK
jgi:quinol monooxygenase YgiN